MELTGEMPSDFLLVGVQGSCFDLGASLTTPVRRAVPRVMSMVLSELKAHVRRPGIWWDAVLDGYPGTLCA